LKRSDIVVSVLVLGLVMLILIPLNSAVLDFLLIINLTISILILLTNLFIKKALEFSTFPTVLLFLTLYRLALNIASTKLILGNGGDAGKVIKAFGQFVVGSNLVVGFVIFLIIVLVQFIVITKGAERVAEVAARFTLDAMPGKQMAIDADLNTGIIDDREAQSRRNEIQQEAAFFGAMDGASKFVKGDAIMGIVITIVNVIGGILIGATGFGGGAVLPMDQVFSIYLLAVIGDGLVSQMPALIVSTATGVIVTRSASNLSFGQDVSAQLFARPTILYVLGGMLALLGLIPGLPTIPILGVSIAIIATAYFRLRHEEEEERVEDIDVDEEMAEEKRRPESINSLLHVDTIALEFGYGIISMVDASQGGDLLDRVVMIRRQCALDLGIIVPVVRLRDNVMLETNSYSIKIKGIEVASGEIMIDHYLALKPTDVDDEINGIETVDPTFGFPALWITEDERENAELRGYTTIDAPSVISTHLLEIIRRHAHELLGRQQVQVLLDNLKEEQPALVDEVVPKLFSNGEVQKVLAGLLKEGISIRDMGSVLEVLGDHGALIRDTDLLTEYVRQSFKRWISQKFIQDGKAHVITLDPSLEQRIAESIRQTEQGTVAVLQPSDIQKVLSNLKSAMAYFIDLGISPMVLTSPAIRKDFKRLSEQLDPDLIVLSYNEIEQGVEIYSDRVLNI